MPNPRKPTKLKELQGTLQPCRVNKFEPVPVGVLGDPPLHLGLDEKMVWLEISESLPPGVATSSDMLLVEIVARLMAEFRKGEISSSGMSALMRGLSQLGMSPADRSKIVVKKEEKNGRFDRFK